MTTRFVLSSTACAVVLLGCGQLPTEPEATQRVSSAIGSGTSTGAQFSSVAELNMFGDVMGNFTGGCSGTLVAPSWVLTANHCITGGSPTSSGNDMSWDTSLTEEMISVDFSSSINAGAACNTTGGTCFMHNGPGATGFTKAVLVRMDHEVDMTSSSDYDNDIALVQLDTPVPPTVARPAPIAGLKANIPQCPTGFTGTLVGYGPRFGDPIDAFGTKVIDSAMTDRNQATSSGWSRSSNDNGQTWSYGNSWGPWEVLGVVTAYDSYQGIEAGDSGGPLFLNDGLTPFGNFGAGIICGVNSHFGVGGVPPVDATATSDEAGVDAPQNLAWLRSTLLVPGTQRITGLCDDDTDPSGEPPFIQVSLPPTLAQMPTCAVAGNPPGYLNGYKFRLPTVISSCAPGEATQIAGTVTAIDGVALGLNTVPIGPDGVTTTFQLPRAETSYAITWTASDSAGATATVSGVFDCRATPGDINSDHRADIIAAGVSVTMHVGTKIIQEGLTPVALSNGDGTFAVPTPSLAGLGGTQLVAGNFVGGGGTNPAGVLALNPNGDVFLAQSLGGGAFSSQVASTTIFGPFSQETSAQLLAGDFNGDQQTDFLATGTSWWLTLPIAFSNHDGTFTVQNQSGVPGNTLFAEFAGQTPGKVVSGDFDGDGFCDLAATGGKNWGSLPVAFSQGDGTFVTTNEATTFQFYSSGPDAFVYAGDFNGDGRTDIVMLSDLPNGTSPMPIAQSNGDGTFTVINKTDDGDFAIFASQVGAKVVVGDFNGDGLDDLAATGGEGWGTLPVAFSNGDGSFTTTNLATTFQQYSSQAGVKVLSSSR